MENNFPPLDFINDDLVVKDKVIIYLDGSCDNKNGYGAYGVVLVIDGKVKAELSSFIQEKSSSVSSEIHGCLCAIKMVKLLKEVIGENLKYTIYCDNQFAVKYVNNDVIYYNATKFMEENKSFDIDVTWNANAKGCKHHNTCHRLANEMRKIHIENETQWQ